VPHASPKRVAIRATNFFTDVFLMEYGNRGHGESAEQHGERKERMWDEQKTIMMDEADGKNEVKSLRSVQFAPKARAYLGVCPI
jgi:hypothetical protein